MRIKLNPRSKLFIAFFFIQFTGFCQYGDLGIKQRFDNVYANLYGPFYNISSSTNNINDQGVIVWDKSKLYEQSGGVFTQACDDSQDAIGSSRSGSLEALLRMYEVTCDMKYIWEFMEQATQIINMRADKLYPQQSGNPYLFVNVVPWHGRILFPLAHFAYLVNTTPLSGIQIPTAHRVNFNNHTTIGAFADAVNIQNIEMMHFLLERFWRRPSSIVGPDECMCKPNYIGDYCANGSMDNNSSKSISELNYQGPYGAALIYMYLRNPGYIPYLGKTGVEAYAVKVVEMARAYLVTRNGILTYQSANNNYGWFHDGWQQKKENGVWVRSMVHTEDIGHGIWDLIFPILYNKFYSSFTGPITSGQYFENYQMVRFRNTFTKVIYNQYIAANCNVVNQNSFDCNVFGSCSGHYGSTDYHTYQMDAKSWTDLYIYDNVSGAQSGPTVYSIMMDYYINVESCKPIDRANYETAGILGLANMAVANYKMENIYCNAQGSNPRSATIGTTELTLSPNPSTGIFQVNTDMKVINVRVFDGAGRKLIDLDNKSEVDASALSNGTYFVAIKLEDETTYSVKWTKQ